MLLPSCHICHHAKAESTKKPIGISDVFACLYIVSISMGRRVQLANTCKALPGILLLSFLVEWSVCALFSVPSIERAAALL